MPRRLGTYFPMSTANPTGVRPWNFAFQGLGVYSPNTFPLPTASRGPLMLTPGYNGRQKNTIALGDLLYNPPLLRMSPFGGKNQYGLPTPIYTPLAKGFFSGLGAVPNGSQNFVRRVTFPNQNASIQVQNQGPSYSQLQNQLAQAQQSVNQLTAQQAAYNLAQAGAVTAAGTPIASATSDATTTTTAPSWFTDPTQELISGVPNWELVAGAVALLLLFKRK